MLGKTICQQRIIFCLILALMTWVWGCKEDKGSSRPPEQKTNDKVNDRPKGQSAVGGGTKSIEREMIEISELINAIAENKQTLQPLIEKMQTGLDEAGPEKNAEFEATYTEDEDSWNLMKEDIILWGQRHQTPNAMPSILAILGKSPANFNVRSLAERMAVGAIQYKGFTERIAEKAISEKAGKVKE